MAKHTVRAGLLLSTFALALSTGCGKKQAPTSTRQVLRFSLSGDPATLDPALMTGSAEIMLADALFEGLTARHPRDLSPQPGLAEKWDVSEDGLTYTFHLRPAKWSNGEPLTAHDFAYSWRRALAPKTGAEYAYLLYCIKNAEAFNSGKTTVPDSVAVTAPDEATLQVVLERPTAYFLELTAFPILAPVSRTCVENHAGQWTRPENMVCNGAFVLKQQRQQQDLSLARNPLYWGAANVKLEEIRALVVRSEDTAFRMYHAGELDWLRGMPAAKIERMKGREDYRCGPHLGTEFYRFNVTKPPLDDVRVRKALSLAIDRAVICKHIRKRGEQAARSFAPTFTPNYEPAQGLGTDVATAQKLLAEAGYPGGKGFPKLEILYNTSDDRKKVALAVQDMWQKNLGIEVAMLNQEWKIYLANMKNLQYDVARSSWVADYADANTFLEIFISESGNNRTGWAEERYDKLIAEAAQTVDAAERRQLLRKAESVLLNEGVPIAPLYFYTNVYLLSPKVKGFHHNVLDLHPFKSIEIAQ